MGWGEGMEDRIVTMTIKKEKKIERHSKMGCLSLYDKQETKMKKIQRKSEEKRKILKKKKKLEEN